VAADGSGTYTIEVLTPEPATAQMPLSPPAERFTADDGRAGVRVARPFPSLTDLLADQPMPLAQLSASQASEYQLRLLLPAPEPAWASYKVGSVSVLEAITDRAVTGLLFNSARAQLGTSTIELMVRCPGAIIGGNGQADGQTMRWRYSGKTHDRQLRALLEGSALPTVRFRWSSGPTLRAPIPTVQLQAGARPAFVVTPAATTGAENPLQVYVRSAELTSSRARRGGALTHLLEAKLLLVWDAPGTRPLGLKVRNLRDAAGDWQMAQTNPLSLSGGQQEVTEWVSGDCWRRQADGAYSATVTVEQALATLPAAGGATVRDWRGDVRVYAAPAAARTSFTFTRPGTWITYVEGARPPGESAAVAVVPARAGLHADAAGGRAAMRLLLLLLCLSAAGCLERSTRLVLHADGSGRLEIVSPQTFPDSDPPRFARAPGVRASSAERKGADGRSVRTVTLEFRSLSALARFFAADSGYRHAPFAIHHVEDDVFELRIGEIPVPRRSGQGTVRLSTRKGWGRRPRATRSRLSPDAQFATLLAVCAAICVEFTAELPGPLLAVENGKKAGGRAEWQLHGEALAARAAEEWEDYTPAQKAAAYAGGGTGFAGEAIPAMVGSFLQQPGTWTARFRWQQGRRQIGAGWPAAEAPVTLALAPPPEPAADPPIRADDARLRLHERRLRRDGPWQPRKLWAEWELLRGPALFLPADRLCGRGRPGC
jgi:hypothetical protein